MLVSVGPGQKPQTVGFLMQRYSFADATRPLLFSFLSRAIIAFDIISLHTFMNILSAFESLRKRKNRVCENEFHLQLPISGPFENNV